MTAPPAEIRAAASREVLALAVEGDAPAPDVHVLLDETVAVVGEDGAWRYQRRLVFQPLTADAAAAWGTWHVPWDTWRASRPKLEARVMQADGDVYTLDPSLVAEASAGADPLLLTDSKAFQAPLPQIEAGAIVEQVMTYDRVEPMLAGQFFLNTYLERSQPVERMVVHIDAPRDLELHTALVAVDQEMVRKKKGDRQLLDLVMEDVRPLPSLPAAAPPELPRYRALYVSAAPDWASVAAAYQAMVGAKLDPAGLEPLTAPLSGLSRDALIATALDEVLGRVRYTGVLFGQTRIVPNAPAETLNRGFGDCKDQSSLLVTLLRSAGVPANLALLNASTAEDLPAGVPSMSYFDHAIVYVPGPEPRWIDPTQPSESSVFAPADLQGRMALIIDPSTTGLTRIPRSPAQASVWREELTYDLPYRGKGTAVEDASATGLVAASSRALYQMLGDDEQASLVRRAENVFETKIVRAANVTPRSALQTTWRSHIEAEQVGAAVSTVGGAVVRPWPFHGAVNLPSALVSSPPPDAPRVGLEFTPYIYQMVLKIRHPEDLEPQLLAEKNSFVVGDVHIEREVSRAPGLLTITVSLDAGAGQLSADDADALRTVLRGFEPWPVDGVLFQNKALRPLVDGDAATALPLLRAAAAAHPEDPSRQTDLVRADLAVGLMEAARRDLAPVLDRDLAEVRFVEAALLARDPYGRYLRGRFDREGAVAAARRALAIDPEHDEARDLLISLLERNAQGAWLGEGADPCGAAEALETYVVERGDNTRGEEFITMSLHCPDHEPLEAWMDTVSGTVITGARVTLEVLERGAAATIKGMSSRGELRRDWVGVGKAMFMLVDLGRYDLALEVADTSRPLLSADEQQRLDKVREYLASLAKASDRPAALDDPEGVIIAAFRASGAGKAGAVEPFIASGYSGARARAQLVRFFTLTGSESKASTLATTLIGLSTFAVDGDKATGYRVTWRMDSGDTHQRSQIYLIPGKGRLLVLTEGAHPGPIGAYAASLAARGEVKAAMTWLGWAADGASQTSARSPLERSPWLHLLRLADPGRPLSVEAAALALAQEQEPTLERVKRLEELRAALPDAELRVQLDRAIYQSLSNLERPEASVAAINRLLEAFPDEPSLLLTRLGLQAYLDPDAAELGLKALDPIRTSPDRMAGIAGAVAIARRDYATAVEVLNISGDRGGLSAMNNALWFSLFMESLPADLADRGARFEKAIDGSDASRVNTLASVEAATNDQVRAASRLMEALDQGWVVEQDLAEWWFVRALIAEAVGETELAIAAYRAAPRHGVPSEDLGLRRLQGLGARP